jgi:hypothetical protein
MTADHEHAAGAEVLQVLDVHWAMRLDPILAGIAGQVPDAIGWLLALSTQTPESRRLIKALRRVRDALEDYGPGPA